MFPVFMSQTTNPKERVSVLLPADLAKRLREVAKHTGVPMSVIVAIGVADVLNNLDKLPHYTKAKVKKA